MRRYDNGDYDSIHEAALDAFVRSDHGRELWQLHFHADISICDTVDEMTRVQKLAILKMDEYWSEKAQDQGGLDGPGSLQSRMPSGL